MEVLNYFVTNTTKTIYILKIPQVKYTFIIFLIFIFTEVRSQDPNYSQFTHNPIYYNPAYTGISSGMTMRFNYRKQWANLPGDFRTYNFNIDLAARTASGSGGLGLMVDKHTAGSGYYERTRIGIPLSVRVPLYENFLVQMGVMTSFVQKSLNWDNLIFVDQLDPRFGNVNPSDFVSPLKNKVTYPDFDIGLAFRLVESTWSGKQMIATAGVAVHHVFTPNESFYDFESPLARKLVITGDFIIQNEDYERVITSYNRGDKGGFKFNPGFIFQKQSEFKSFTLGMNVYKSNIYAGFWYRNETFDLLKSNALILMLGINAKINEESRLKILYSYDVLLNESLYRAAGGTHELTLIFTLDSFSALTGGGRGGSFGRNMMGSRSNRYSAMECSPF